MNDTIITVENLSKSYLVGHLSQAEGRHKYTALRDVVTRGAHNFVNKAVDIMRGRQVVPGDKVEEFWALKDVSFEVKRGEVVGIIGRNGAGKSTLLKILSRITEPTKGRVLLRGRVASLLEVGTGFHPELTGRENIFLNGAILGMTRSEISRKFDEIVAFADVERFLDTPVKRYSSGMYVRLAFAVAAHLDPEIFVIDEVLAVGDAEFQKKCLGKIHDVASREGRTVLFVSHNHAAIHNLCNQAIVITSGIATPKEDVTLALQRYSSERQVSLGSTWRRPSTLPRDVTWFEEIRVEVCGTQPMLQVACSCDVISERSGIPAFIAVDFVSPLMGPIMQAEPTTEPFIGGAPGRYRVDMSIDLPPLVPGVYNLDFWIGSHHSQTIDYIRQAVAIEIMDMPNPQRTYPYTPEHGFVAPKSCASVTQLHYQPSSTTNMSTSELER